MWLFRLAQFGILLSRPEWASSLGRRPEEKCLLWTSSNAGGELSLIVVSFVKRMRRT